jgi:hypothetical protein
LNETQSWVRSLAQGPPDRPVGRLARGDATARRLLDTLRGRRWRASGLGVGGHRVAGVPRIRFVSNALSAYASVAFSLGRESLLRFIDGILAALTLVLILLLSLPPLPDIVEPSAGLTPAQLYSLLQPRLAVVAVGAPACLLNSYDASHEERSPADVGRNPHAFS